MSQHNIYFGVEKLIQTASIHRFLRCICLPVARLMDRLLGFGHVNRYISGRNPDWTPCEFFTDMVSHFQLTYSGVDRLRQQLPSTGGCLVVANHPTGLAETIVLAQACLSVRKDVMIIANDSLKTIPIVADVLLDVDVFNDRQGLMALTRRMREWLKQGGCLLVFPAGEVSDFQKSVGERRDRSWMRLPFALAKATSAAILTVRVTGKNTPLFYMMKSSLKPLRVLGIMRQLLNKAQVPQQLYCSSPYAGKLLAASNDKCMAGFFQQLCYQLGAADQRWLAPSVQKDSVALKPLDALPAIAHLQSEIAALPADAQLLSQGSFIVYQAPAASIPHIVDYIQVAREITFRDAGMGTGNSRDGDDYDAQSIHIIVWDTRAKALVGASRYQSISTQTATSYLSSLYDVNYAELSAAGGCMEISRSFVMPVYQKKFSSLLSYFRGVSQALLRLQGVRYLVGVVSIEAGDLSQQSLDVLHAYVKQVRAQTRHANCWQPKAAYEPTSALSKDMSKTLQCTQSLAECEYFISQLAGETVTFPVLFRQYEVIGTAPLAMSVDESFSDCVDVLMVWDTHELSAVSRIEMLFGKDGMAALQQRKQAGLADVD